MATCRVCSATLTDDPSQVNGPYGEDGSGKTLLESQVSKAIGGSLCTYHWMQVLEGNDNTAIASVEAQIGTMFANVQITGGGVITWSGTHLLWTQRLIAIPVESTEFGSAGFIDMDCPTSGTVLYYPEGGGTSTVACTANGIPIGNWEALYYRFVRGSGSASDQTRFCVVHYQNADWSPDDGWILLATRNADNISSSVKVAVGVTIPATGGTYDVDACLPDWIAPINVTGLSGLLADDQHVLDAEALAAAVQSGAITNAVTKAPTHDAVFDVKATADGAIAKSLLTTRGDIIYRNATVPARLAKGTEGHVLTMGASDPAWAAGATKEIYTPVYGWLTAAVPLWQGVLLDGPGEQAMLMLLVPHDFTAITSLEIILLPQATGANMKVFVQTYFGAYNGGEAYNVGSETEFPRDIGATVDNRNLAHSIADLTTGLAAGDILTARMGYDVTAVASNVYVRGLRLRYS